MKRLTRPRAGRPENARVSSVWVKTGSVTARLCRALAPDSGQTRNAVPSCAASAPTARTEAIWSPRISPPVAMTGSPGTASRTCGTSASRPTPAQSSSGSSRWVPWWPPASMPCTHTASAPARCAASASAAEVTVITVTVPTAFSAASVARAGQPKVKLTTGTGLSIRIETLASYASSLPESGSPSGVSYQAASPASCSA